MGTTSTIEYKDHDDQKEATAQTRQEHHCMPPFVTMTTKCGSTKKLAFCLFRYAQPPKISLLHRKTSIIYLYVAEILRFTKKITHRLGFTLYSSFKCSPM